MYKHISVYETAANGSRNCATLPILLAPPLVIERMIINSITAVITGCEGMQLLTESHMEFIWTIPPMPKQAPIHITAKKAASSLLPIPLEI